MEALGAEARTEARVYLVGGATAVLVGWRDSTIETLAKLERGHQKDMEDVRAMRAEGLVETPRLLQFFAQIEPSLYRFPSIDPRAFRRSVEVFAGSKT
jgi:hypothetical protein